jgi:hypothetical protein
MRLRDPGRRSVVRIRHASALSAALVLALPAGAPVARAASCVRAFSAGGTAYEPGSSAGSLP